MFDFVVVTLALVALGPIDIDVKALRVSISELTDCLEYTLFPRQQCCSYCRTLLISWLWLTIEHLYSQSAEMTDDALQLKRTI
jgi:hypothetical protein